MKEKINIGNFFEASQKIEIKVGNILKVEDVPKSEKLLKLTVDFGKDDVRTVVTNIKLQLNVPLSLEGTSMLFVTNLEPVKIMGIESTAMILPGNLSNKQLPYQLKADPGTEIL